MKQILNSLKTQAFSQFKTSKATLYSSSLLALILATLALPTIWQQIFPKHLISTFIATTISFFWMTVLFVSNIHLWQKKPHISSAPVTHSSDYNSTQSSLHNQPLHKCNRNSSGRESNSLWYHRHLSLYRKPQPFRILKAPESTAPRK